MRDDYPNETAALQKVADKPGTGPRATLQNRLKPHESDTETRPGTTTKKPARPKTLKKENTEPKQATHRPQLQNRPSNPLHPQKHPIPTRPLHDKKPKERIQKIYTSNYRVYGVRKIWRELNRQGRAAARCTVECLMRELGIQGAVRGKRVITTLPGGQVERAPDLVDRNFVAGAPNRCWVVEFTM